MGVPEAVALPGPAARLKDMRRAASGRTWLRQDYILLGDQLAVAGSRRQAAEGAQQAAAVLPFSCRTEREKPFVKRVC